MFFFLKGETVDALFASAWQQLWPEAARGEQRTSAGEPGGAGHQATARAHQSALVSRLPAQDGPKVQDVEQALVRVRPPEAHPLLLHGPTRDEAARQHLLSVDQRGLRRPHAHDQVARFQGHLCGQNIRQKLSPGGALKRDHAHLGRGGHNRRRGLLGIQRLNTSPPSIPPLPLF